MNRRKILYLNHVGLVAGAERSLLTLIESLDRSRYEAWAVCPAGPLADLLIKGGAQVRTFSLERLHRTRNPFRLVSYAKHALTVSRGIANGWDGPEIDLIHSNSTTAHIYGVLLARRWRVPCVWHVRDLVPLGALGRLLYWCSDVVIATSNAVASCVARAVGDEAKLRIIPNSINLNVCAPPDAGARVRKELRVNESAPLVAVVGQLVPWKRHDVFLKALASVVKQVPETVGLIVGDDLFEDNSGYKLEISDLARQLALERNAKFLGWRDDVYAVLAACDLLVIPSQAEPFGRVALEAMAMGKPVVGTRAGGLPDVVADGETGWLFPPGDHVALAAAILRALSEPATAKRMGEAGRERVRKLFDSKLTTRSVEDLYEVLLSRRRGEL